MIVVISVSKVLAIFLVFEFPKTKLIFILRSLTKQCAISKSIKTQFYEEGPVFTRRVGRWGAILDFYSESGGQPCNATKAQSDGKERTNNMEPKAQIRSLNHLKARSFFSRFSSEQYR